MTQHEWFHFIMETINALAQKTSTIDEAVDCYEAYWVWIMHVCSNEKESRDHAVVLTCLLRDL